VEALQGQRFDAALETFESLYRQSPRPTLLYYLGKVALGQQRTVAAADLYRRFLKESGDDIDADTRSEVQQFLASLPTAECEVTAQGDAGALLLADGRIVGTLPRSQPLQLSPGAHKLSLEKGRRKVETQVTLLARRRAEVRFTLLPPLALLTLTPGVLMLTQMEPRSLEPSLLPALQSAMQPALSRQNAVLVGPETLAEILRRSPELGKCGEETSCQEMLGQLTSAQFVLRLSVQSEAAVRRQPSPPGASPEGGAIRFTAKLLDVDVGLVSVEATQSCADCNVKQALSQLGDTVEELLRQAAARPRGTLVVDSQPQGALVQLDGHTLGTTPYRREAFIGPHEVTVSKPGYASHAATVNISDSEPTQLDVTLPQNPVPPPSGSRGRYIAKWTLFGSGLALTAVGAILIGVSNAQSCPMMPSSPTAPSCSTFNGLSAGVPLLILGVGALGASGVLFLLDRPAAAPAPALQADPPAAQSAIGLTLLGF
jgi:hypothetical protein